MIDLDLRHQCASKDFDRSCAAPVLHPTLRGGGGATVCVAMRHYCASASILLAQTFSGRFWPSHQF